jgi:adenylate cyclase
MRRALAEYNATLARDGMSPLVVGIGIHRGPVVAGVIGTAGLVEYGVVGQTLIEVQNGVARLAGPPRRHRVAPSAAHHGAATCAPCRPSR